MSEDALTVNSLCYSYKSDWLRAKIPVLKNVSFSVMPGEAFGFLGHNGAGKTTTIKCILGLCSPSAGEIAVFGSDVLTKEFRQHVGYLPEQPYFYENLTVAESLKAYAGLSGVRKEEFKERIEEVLARLGLLGRRESKLRSLSKGLLQRVGMAQAIVNHPRILILDEPFSGLDPIGRKEFRELILDLKKKGTTIMMSSHILSDVEALCDRASIMVKGEIKGIFSMTSLAESPTTKFEIIFSGPGELARTESDIRTKYPTSIINSSRSHLTIGSHSYDEALGIVEIGISNKCSLVSFNSERTSLEDIFVSMVEGAR